MRCEVVVYEHRDNGLSLFVVPETDAERALLDGLWKHGELNTCNGVADRSSKGYCVAWKLTPDKQVQ
jgi:hypothetical protein